MAYATQADIELKYGSEIVKMVTDYSREATETAEDALNDAIEAGQPQNIIDDLSAAYTAALASESTNAAATIAANLDYTAAKIDGFTLRRYPNPWTTEPPLLKTLNIDLAVYEISLAADWRTEEMKTRADLALKTLKDIRDGNLDLTGGVTEADATEVGTSGSMTMGTWTRR